jgi:hypothetical protein
MTGRRKSLFGENSLGSKKWKVEPKKRRVVLKPSKRNIPRQGKKIRKLHKEIEKLESFCAKQSPEISDDSEKKADNLDDPKSESLLRELSELAGKEL